MLQCVQYKWYNDLLRWESVVWLRRCAALLTSIPPFRLSLRHIVRIYKFLPLNYARTWKKKRSQNYIIKITTSLVAEKEFLLRYSAIWTTHEFLHVIPLFLLWHESIHTEEVRTAPLFLQMFSVSFLCEHVNHTLGQGCTLALLRENPEYFLKWL